MTTSTTRRAALALATALFAFGAMANASALQGRTLERVVKNSAIVGADVVAAMQGEPAKVRK